MYLHEEPPPAWIADDGYVGRRMVARRDDPPMIAAWWSLVEVVRCCRGLLVAQGASPAALHLRVVTALRELKSAAVLLPAPMTPVIRELPTWEEPVAHLRVCGPRLDVLATLSALVCQELDGSMWTCPLWLAGIADDLRLALLTYRRALRRQMALSPVGAACLRG